MSRTGRYAELILDAMNADPSIEDTIKCLRFKLQNTAREWADLRSERNHYWWFTSDRRRLKSKMDATFTEFAATRAEYLLLRWGVGLSGINKDAMSR